VFTVWTMSLTATAVFPVTNLSWAIQCQPRQ